MPPQIPDDESLDGYYSDNPLSTTPNYPELKENFDTCIIVTNIPKIPEAKVEKLTKVLLKLFRRIGNLVSDEESGYNGLYLPFNKDKGSTEGFAIVEYETKEEASQALSVLENYKFDKNHHLTVVPYDSGMGLKDLEEEFADSEPAPFVEKPNTWTFCEDNSQREQFVIRQGRETTVFWSDAKHTPVVDYDGEREKKNGTSWCEYYVNWSPQGSYFATLVPSKGVILWGGASYEKIGRFPHQGVQFVVFSPKEKFLLTCNNNANSDDAIKIFNVQTGKLLRAFPLYPTDFARTGSDGQPIPPPPFLWSYDEKYVARIGKDLISVYETPSIKLLDRRSLQADKIQEFQWSPKANIIAYWAPEVRNSPAHVDLIEIPTRKKLRQKNLFNVSKCSMVFQLSGDYLSVKVTRHTKSKKTLYNNIELFRMNEPGIPVEMLDIKDAVMAFAWEPKGSRFAMIHAENPTSTKTSVSYYNMMKKVDDSVKNKKKKKVGKAKGPEEVAELNKIVTLEGKQSNCLFWSPAGNVVLMASLGDTASGTLEFYDIDNQILLATKDHYRANQVLWDPSGRSVTTVVSQPIQGGHFKFAMDNGYVLWTFQGKQLHQQSFETFYQFQWRPRPNLLNREQQKDVVKNLKKFEKIFDRQDRERHRAIKLEETKGKRALRAAFREEMALLALFRKGQKAERVELLGGYDSEDESNYVMKKVTLESFMSTKEDVVY